MSDKNQKGQYSLETSSVVHFHIRDSPGWTRESCSVKQRNQMQTVLSTDPNRSGGSLEVPGVWSLKMKKVIWEWDFAV